MIDQLGEGHSVRRWLVKPSNMAVVVVIVVVSVSGFVFVLPDPAHNPDVNSTSVPHSGVTQETPTRHSSRQNNSTNTIHEWIIGWWHKRPKYTMRDRRSTKDAREAKRQKLRQETRTCSGQVRRRIGG